MKKLKGINWDINTDTNTINIHKKLTTEQLARIVDSAADYERSLAIRSLDESIYWTINITEELSDLKSSKLPEAIKKAIEEERYEGPGIPPMKKKK